LTPLLLDLAPLLWMLWRRHWSKLCSKIGVCRSLQYGVWRSSIWAWKIFQKIL